MIARIESWEIKELGPAFHYGSDEADGSHSYPAMTDVSLRVRIVGGNDARRFLSMVEKLSKGAELKAIEISSKPGVSRKYVFE